MKTTATATIENYRKLVQTYLNLHAYETALYWADKVVSLTDSPRDVYWLAQCMYLLKQYQRAAHLLRSRSLESSFLLCNYLTVKCLLETNELKEALNVISMIELETLVHGSMHHSASQSGMMHSNIDSLFFDDTPRNQILASVFLLRGKVLESMDNRGLALDCYKQALRYDVYCYEAFNSLIKYQMLSAAEEQALLNSMPISQQCNQEEAEVLVTLYQSKMKKYQTSLATKMNENAIVINHFAPNIFVTPTNLQSSPLAPIVIITPTTPDVARNNDKNLEKTGLKSESESKPEGSIVVKLKDSLDLQVAEAERLYYNCEYQECNQLTEAILKKDPYHSDCLPIHISCQVELKQSNKLFSLAHNLVDLYPNLAISWFAVGCYYYILGKSDPARRYLSKATCLDRLFGPAWLAYGHSFAVENEHDQAMAAYFKACQLMRGCHLPLLYIGLECGLTNNVKLAEKFFKRAQSIAPEDPFVMNEMGVIAFQNSNFKQAEKYFNEALNRVKKIRGGLIPRRWESLLNNLGHTCRKLKKYQESLDYHHEALVLSPQSPSTYSAIAYNHALMGHTSEAVEWFHKALGLKNDDSFCTTMLNYVMEQFAEETPAYPNAPPGIPKFDLETSPKESDSELPSASEEMAGVSMSMSMSSIEVDMADASGMVKE